MSVILSIHDLKITFPIEGKEIPAVDGISFNLHQGKVLGIVGESGCGKTVTALSLLRLIDPPGKIEAGKAIYYGAIPELGVLPQIPTPEELSLETATRAENNLEEEDLTPDFTGAGEEATRDLTASVITPEEEPHGGIDLFHLKEEDMRVIRGNKIAMIFQEPMTSLNPVFTVGDQVMEAIILHQRVGKKEAEARAVEMLRKVRIPDPEKRLYDYPHQLSGGMRQRVMIAMALSCQPDILIADEPTTALDVTIQAQILDLIQELIQEMHMSVILITHDLGVVAQVCDDVLVMYSGVIVEQAPAHRLFRMPKHPYTLGLMESIPQLFGEEERLHTIAGLVPDIARRPSGCPFTPRCPRAVEACGMKLPPPRYFGEGQDARCINT